MSREQGKLDVAAKDMGGKWITSTIEWLIAGVMIGFLFPLLDWSVLFTAGFIFALVALIVISQMGWRWALLIVLAVFITTSASVIHLTFAQGTKYVVSVDNPLDALKATTDTGPRGPYHVVPTYSLVPIKLWLLKGVAAFRSDFVFLEAKQIGDRVIAHSPSEIAAANISRKPPNSTGMIYLPAKTDSLQLNIVPKPDYTAELSASMGFSGIGPALRTNISPNTPGLFGLSSSKAFTQEEWRSLAYSEELVRSLPTVSMPEILQSLATESRRTGSWNDLLRELDLRLALMGNRYSDVLTRSGGKLDAYELAVAGNLRYVAESLNARSPDKSLYGNPWLEDLSFKLLESIGQLPMRNMNLVDEKGSRELSWVVDTLKRLTEMYQEQSLLANLNTPPPDKGSESAIVGKALEQMKYGKDTEQKFAALLNAFKMMGTVAEPIPTGESATVAAMKAKGASLTTDEVLNWIKRGGEDRAWRVSQTIELVGSENDLFRKLGPVMASRNRERDLKDLTRETVRALKFYQTTYEKALPFIQDQDERRLLANKLEITSVPMRRMIEFMTDIGTCGHSNAAKICVDDDNGAMFIEKMFSAVQPELSEPLKKLFQVMENGPFGPVFADSSLGTPYSYQEFTYMLALSRVTFDWTLPSYDLTEPCADTEQRALALLVEDRLPERASVLSVQAALLRRCGSPVAAKIVQAMRERQMPLPSWFPMFANGLTPVFEVSDSS